MNPLLAKTLHLLAVLEIECYLISSTRPGHRANERLSLDVGGADGASLGEALSLADSAGGVGFSNAFTNKLCGTAAYLN